MTLLDFVLGASPALLQAVLLIILNSRRLTRVVPWFAGYTLYSINVTIARLWIMKEPRPFFVVYWSTEIVYGIGGLFALTEVLRPSLQQFYFAPRWTRALPPLVTAIVIAVTLWRAIYHPLGRGAMARFAAGAYALMPGILCLQALVFFLCLYLAFKKDDPVRWGRYRAGILIGFGLAACAAVCADILRSHFGREFEDFFRYVPAAAYVGATLVWLIAFSKIETETPSEKPDAKLLKQVAQTLTRAADRAERDWRNLNFGPSAAE